MIKDDLCFKLITDEQFNHYPLLMLIDIVITLDEMGYLKGSEYNDNDSGYEEQLKDND